MNNHHDLRARLIKFLAVSVFTALCLSPLYGQESLQGPDTTSGTNENSTGIVTKVNPGGTITVDSRRGPFTYRVDMDLDVRGVDGRHLKLPQVQRGSTVTVYYHFRDAYPSVDRIIVLKSPRTTAQK